MFTVILPSYNERWRLPSTLRDIQVFHEEHEGWISQVIVVDDGSRDATAECAMHYVRKLPLIVVKHNVNRGKWMAIREGLASAKTDAVLLLDADGSASIFELERFLQRSGVSLEGFLDWKLAVFGSRFMNGAVVEGKSLMRMMVSRVYRRYVKGVYFLCGGDQVIDDMQAPFKFLWLSKVRGGVDALCSERFAGDVELALRYEGWVLNHPLQFLHKRGSRVPIYAVWEMFVETLRVGWRSRRW